MRLLYPSAKSFAKVMEIIYNIIDEGIFRFTTKGINLIAMDPSQRSMVIFNMPKEVFKEYEVEEDLNLGVDIDYLKKILKRTRANEMLELIYDKQLKIIFSSKKTKREFIIPLLDLTDSLLDELKIEYKNKIKIRGETLRDIVNDASILSNYVKFIITPDGFYAQSKNDNSTMNEEFKIGEDLLFVQGEGEEGALFPIDYLTDILKAIRKDDVIELMVEKNKPLKMEFVMEGAHIKYFLVPSSEEEWM